MTSKILLSLVAASALVACNGEADAAGGGELPVADAPIEAVDAPEGTTWTETVETTAGGGYLMGNPDAPVQVIEFASLTCPACAYFEQTGYEPLKELVDSGRVSFEFRNYTLNALDTTASILARCGEPSSFFPLKNAMYASQQQWSANTPELAQAIQAAQGRPSEEQFALLADASGLKTFAVQRGLPASRADECLSDISNAERLLEMNNEAQADFDVRGTPTFVINGVTSDASQWEQLEPQLKAALGEE